MENLINRISKLPVNVQKIELQTLIDIRRDKIMSLSNCNLPFIVGLTKTCNAEINMLTNLYNNL